MCPFYNAQLFEITGAAKGVFTRSQSSCHIAKVVLTIRPDSRQIPIASDARPFHTSRGFRHWRFAYAGPTVRAAPPSWGRHPQTFTKTEVASFEPHVCSAPYQQTFSDADGISQKCHFRTRLTAANSIMCRPSRERARMI